MTGRNSFWLRPALSLNFSDFKFCLSEIFHTVVEHAEHEAVSIAVGGTRRQEECGSVERILVEDVVVNGRPLAALHPDDAQTLAAPEGKRIDYFERLRQVDFA